MILSYFRVICLIYERGDIWNLRKARKLDNFKNDKKKNQDAS